MPTYDLECTACGERFEVFRQGFLRAEDRSCACGGEGVQRFTGFVTSRPARAPVAPVVTGVGGRGHGAGCGCCRGSAADRSAWRSASGGD